MNVFKFRAWKNGMMSKPFFLGEGVCWPNGSVSTANGLSKVMQFTGLFDRTIKEIYDGDIFTSCDYPFTSDGNINYVGIVAYDMETLSWCAEVAKVSNRVRGGACGRSLSEIDVEDIEVIGNIYENPDLLEIEDEE